MRCARASRIVTARASEAKGILDVTVRDLGRIIEPQLPGEWSKDVKAAGVNRRPSRTIRKRVLNSWPYAPPVRCRMTALHSLSSMEGADPLRAGKEG